MQHDASRLCASHPAAGIATCPHCGTFVCDQCVVRHDWGALACRECVERRRPRFPLSWEQRISLRSWWQTFATVLRQPRALFSHFPELAGPRALGFAAIGTLADQLAGEASPAQSPWPLWLDVLSVLTLTPLGAAALWVVLRLAKPETSFGTILTAIWLMDGTYGIVFAPLSALDPEGLRAGVTIALGAVAMLVVYVRALWFLTRRRLGAGPGLSAAAIGAYFTVVFGLSVALLMLADGPT